MVKYGRVEIAPYAIRVLGPDDRNDRVVHRGAVDDENDVCQSLLRRLFDRESRFLKAAENDHQFDPMTREGDKLRGVIAGGGVELFDDDIEPAAASPAAV